jgi:hypothetical protein
MKDSTRASCLKSNLGVTQEIGPLVPTSSYSAVNAETAFWPVGRLHCCLRVKQARIELSRDHDSIHPSLALLLQFGTQEFFKTHTNELIKIFVTYWHPSPCLLDLEQPHAASPGPCPLLRRPSAGSALPGSAPSPEKLRPVCSSGSSELARAEWLSRALQRGTHPDVSGVGCSAS